MGVVLRAHEDTFRRTLAVKVLLTHHQERSDLASRFLEEAQLMGQLQHPGIPPVYHLGQLDDGRPYFSMKLVKGRTLAALLRERSSPAQEPLRFLDIFAQLCQTLAYAHSHGIIHRDLKPANIMVGAFGEVQVMDWGLAKVMANGRCQPPGTDEYRGVDTSRSPEASREETRSGAVLGTLSYMAPEQARGEVERLDERCDVFGLGAILCVMLTGQPPHVGISQEEVHCLAAQGDLADAYARLNSCTHKGK
jgi:serine/threonine-protein kinase